VVSAESWRKFPEFVPENHCVRPWYRVTFVVSPGKRKIKTGNRPECEPTAFTARRVIIEKGPSVNHNPSIAVYVTPRPTPDTAARTFRERNCR
jgi:hypothetical protein